MKILISKETAKLNDELNVALRILLASSFALYIKAQKYHWNVEGEDFAQYHSYFGDLYSEIGGSLDKTAEEIRQIGFKSPGGLAAFARESLVQDDMMDEDEVETEDMFEQLVSDNQTIIEILYKAREIADAGTHYGTVNYLEERINAHKKHAWMLESFTK